MVPPSQTTVVSIVPCSNTSVLAVTLPGQAPKRFDKLPNASPNWKKLDWLGFCSLAREKTVFYLDNLALSPSGVGK
jgi:hypothetical protein